MSRPAEGGGPLHTAEPLLGPGAPAPELSVDVPVPSSTGDDGLSGATARGAGLTLAGQAARILVQFASVVVLARMLSPRDYGLLAIGLVVVGIGEVFRDLGLSTAALRVPALSRRQRDGLFWLNTAAGLVVAAAAVCTAAPIATAFSEPELEPVIRALAGTFVLNGLAAQYRAGLSRQLRFGAVAAADVAAQLVSFAVAVTAAGMGAAYWALVVQQLTQAAIGLVLVVALARWLPGRPRRGAGLRPLLRFGSGVTGTQVVYYLGSNLDNLSLGLWAGPAALGVYNRGYQLLMTPLNQLRSPGTTLAVPVLSRLEREPLRFDEYLVRGQLALGYTLVTGLALVAGAAGPVVDLVLGDRWHAVAPVLALLAVAGSAQTLAYVGLWVYLTRGLSAALLRYHLVTLVLSAGCIAAGSPFGVLGVAAGYAAAALLEWPLSLWWLSRVTEVPLRALQLGAARITACAAAAGGACHAVTQLAGGWPSVARIVAGGLAGLAVYGLAAALPAVRHDLCGVLALGGRMVARGR
ncbi:oligosaccharide flippase family protein [Geodermatophilus sabuli]|uniref:oligosaccharide flippase family protein n=1 Tax=Geodermatophilus sabuli TaxID=1564158 RepID=UPI0019535C7D